MPSLAWARDDFSYRQLLTVKVIDTKKVDLVLFNQLYFNHDAQDISFYHVSPQLKFDCWKNLQLGLNYSHVNLKVFNPRAGREEFRWHHRLELEANPHWDIKSLRIWMRNRYEFRWIENNGSHNPRFRHRTNVELPLQNVLPLISIYANSEFFYDINDHRFNENWTTPVGLKFRINDKANMGIFYMIQSRLTNEWTTNEILGSHLMIDF